MRFQGTWQFKSARNLDRPDVPVLIADELESFFHVLLYNAVHFLPHNYESVRAFVAQYFDGYDIDMEGNYSCPALKRTTMERGLLETAKERIRLRFHYVDGPPSHPLNKIIGRLLVLFAARYTVINSNITQKRYEPQPGYQDRGTIPEAFSFEVDRDGNLVSPTRKVRPKRVDWTSIRAKINKNKISPPGAGVPACDALKLIKRLADHKLVKAIFTQYLYEGSIWRDGDKIQGDRLSNYLLHITQNSLHTDHEPAPAKRPRSQ